MPHDLRPGPPGRLDPHAELAREAAKLAAAQNPSEHRLAVDVDGIVAAMAVHHEPRAGGGRDAEQPAPDIGRSGILVGHCEARLKVGKDPFFAPDKIVEIEPGIGTEGLDRRAGVADPAALALSRTEAIAAMRRPCSATIGPAIAAMLPLSKPPLKQSAGALASRRTRQATASVTTAR